MTGLLRIEFPLSLAAAAGFLLAAVLGVVFRGGSFARTLLKSIRHPVFPGKCDSEKILQDSSKAMASLSLRDLLAYQLHAIKTSLGVDSVFLFIKTGEGRYVQHRSSEETPKVCLPEDAVVEMARRDGRAVLLQGRDSMRKPEGALSAFMSSVEAETAVPLLHRGELQGVLILGKKRGRKRYAAGEIDLLEAIAGHTAVAIVQDLLSESERKARELLQESEERFKNLIETTSDWVWEMNDRGVYTYVSPKIRAILGYEPEEVLGRTFFDFMPREEARRAAHFFVSATRLCRPFMTYENTYLHKSGRIVVIETSGVPVFGRKGEFLGYRGIDRDVTRRNELEGQLRYAQKMEAVGRLAAGLAHDFNNINSVIVGYANLLQLKLEKDDGLREQVDHILSATERSASLTQSLLAFSRKQEIKPCPVNLNDIITSMENLLRTVVRSNIELNMRLAPDDLMISGDQLQIERIFLNLVSNARDAMPNGGHLSIETDEVVIGDQFISSFGYGKPGAYAHAVISDSGVGMGEAVMKRIFEPFFTTKKKGNGTGFGLSIVYDFVKQHQGYLNVTSTPGRGSSFHVYLPLLRTGSVQPRPAKPGEAEAGSMVLVADNDDDDRNFIRGALEGAGYRVIEAIDGADAVKKFKRCNGALHAVVLDIIMPRMSGKEAYRVMRADRRGIKVLFTSSYSEDVTLHRGIVDSNENFILKPFSSKELIDRVRSIL